MVSWNPENFDRGDFEASVNGVDDSHGPGLKDKLEGGVDVHDRPLLGGVLPAVYMEEILANGEDNLFDIPTRCLIEKGFDSVQIDLLRLLGVIFSSGVPTEFPKVNVEE